MKNVEPTIRQLYKKSAEEHAERKEVKQEQEEVSKFSKALDEYIGGIIEACRFFVSNVQYHGRLFVSVYTDNCGDVCYKIWNKKEWHKKSQSIPKKYFSYFSLCFYKELDMQMKEQGFTVQEARDNYRLYSM